MITASPSSYFEWPKAKGWKSSAFTAKQMTFDDLIHSRTHESEWMYFKILWNIRLKWHWRHSSDGTAWPTGWCGISQQWSRLSVWFTLHRLSHQMFASMAISMKYNSAFRWNRRCLCQANRIDDSPIRLSKKMRLFEVNYLPDSTTNTEVGQRREKI